MTSSTNETTVESFLDVSDVHKQYGVKLRVKALDGVSIKVPKGHLVVLLGPSGCGKTTLLRILAGLEDATAGTVSFFGKTIVDTGKRVNVPAKDRNVGMVFQNYALWPHMSVVENVAYPLRNKRVRKAEARRRALEVLKFLRCDHLADRIPAQLSGGQQQRIALGRALVSSPEIVFFDEPLSNVDAQLRREVRAEIRRLHNEIDFTGIYVTHDLSEALELADTIVVMSDGRVEQVGTPQEIFETPASAYVADFMGIENKLDFEMHNGQARFSFGDHAGTGVFERLKSNQKYRAFFRATEVELVRGTPLDTTETALGEWEIVDIMYGGDKTDLILRKDGQKLVSSGSPMSRSGLVEGQRVQIKVDTASTLVYPL